MPYAWCCFHQRENPQSVWLRATVLNKSHRHCSAHVSCAVRNCWSTLFDCNLRSLFQLLNVSLYQPVLSVFSCFSTFLTFLASCVSRDFLFVRLRITSSRFAVEPSRNNSATLWWYAPFGSFGLQGEEWAET